MVNRTYKLLMVIPPVAWVCIFLLTPYTILFTYSFWKVSALQVILHQWNLGNYSELLHNPLYFEVLFRSMRIAASVTALALLVAYPLAYYLAFRVRQHKELLYQLVIIPLWVSYLVRAYAWKTVLGSDGVLNTLLMHFGVIHQPISLLLYSPYAVVLTLTHIYTPFAFFPIYASLSQIPPGLLEASADLGALPRRTFWRIAFPLSMPGVITGATFAFVLTLGDFLAPLLLGGPGGIMISNVVVSLFGAAYNWPLGAAVSFVMLALVLGILWLAEWLEKRLAFS